MGQTELTTETLREIADQVQQLADAYTELADRAESAEVESFPARGVNTLLVAMGRIEANIRSMETTLGNSISQIKRNAIKKSSSKSTGRKKPPASKTRTPKRKAE